MVRRISEDKISVIIPVRNEENKICECLDAIKNQTLSPYEIIIVDGHSTDNTVKNAQKYPVKILYEGHRTIGGARQVGLANAKGEYVAFTDADCIPDFNWLETELNVIKKDKNTAGVGCIINNVGHGIWEDTINEISKTFVGSGRSIQGRQYTKEKTVSSISGCHSLYRRHIIDKVGGFNVKLNICEDTEINVRLRKQGYILKYTPSTKVLHNPNRGIKLYSKRMFQYGYGRAKTRLFDLQVLLPLSLPLLLFFWIFFPFVFFLFIGIYSLLLLIFSISITVKNKKYYFLITVPIITPLQHFAYSLGFWRGILNGGK